MWSPTAEQCGDVRCRLMITDESSPSSVKGWHSKALESTRMRTQWELRLKNSSAANEPLRWGTHTLNWRPKLELNRDGVRHRGIKPESRSNAKLALIDLELERVLVVFVHVLIEYRPEFQQIRSVQVPFVSRQLDDLHVPFGHVRVQFHLVKF